jgi:hypothetical protein
MILAGNLPNPTSVLGNVTIQIAAEVFLNDAGKIATVIRLAN